MNIVIKNLAILLSVFTLISPVHAMMVDDSTDMCAPFKDTDIGQSSIAQMLSAADRGMLYQIDQASSKAGFCVEGPTGLVRADFKRFNGGVALLDNRADEIKTLMALEVDSLESDTFLVASMLKGDTFLDAETFPKIVFIGKSVEWVNAHKAVLKGELTMHGQTREVAFYVTLTAPRQKSYAMESISIKASTTISRQQFGLGALADVVADRVTLCMQFESVRYRVEYL